MDLVIQHTAHKPFRPHTVKPCEILHRRFLDVDIDRVFFIPAGSHKATVAEFLKLMMGDISPSFILTRDNVMLTAPVQAMAYANKKSAWNKRSGEDTNAMVQSIALLAEKGMALVDYEVAAPVIMDKELLKEVLLNTLGHTIMVRTMYFNWISTEPVRIDDTRLPVWTYEYEPDRPIIALDDTCYKVDECVKWLQRMAKD